MRVAVNCCQLRGESGGIRQYVARLIDGLLGAGQHEYVFLHLPANFDTLDELLRPAWRSHARPVGSRREIAASLDDVDLYFCPSGLLWPRPLRVPSVVTLVDAQEAYLPRFFPFRERWSRFYHHAASLRMADRVITISEFCRHGLAAAYQIPPTKIDVAHLAPAEGVEAAPDSDPRLGTLPDRFLLYPANPWLHKNHERLLQALALARDGHGVAIACVLTGMPVTGGYDLAAGIERHGLGGQVRFLGYQPDSIMAALYQRATALVFPSLFEGFGLPLVEAMAAGCPVTCSRSASLPEVAGDAALYFDAEDPSAMADALVKMWTDGELRADVIRRGRIRAQRFSVQAMVEAHLKAFELAVEDFKKHGPRAYPPLRKARDLAVSAWQSLRARPLVQNANRGKFADSSFH